jgi:uncharacterized protein with HEPN domain
VRDHSLYLKDILHAIESIETFMAGMGFEAFLTDDKTTSAVIRKLEIIGEAVKQLPSPLPQGNHPADAGTWYAPLAPTNSPRTGLINLII